MTSVRGLRWEGRLRYCSYLVGPLLALPAALWLMAPAPGSVDAGVRGAATDAAGVVGAAAQVDLYRQRAQAFSRFRTPVPGAAQVVGGTSNGCLLGGAHLPPSGPGFEVLHLGRNRFFGHPDLVAFVRRLAREARRKKLGPLLIGDLSQPRGGPTPTGHRSHQSGLDVDVGFTIPPWMNSRKMTPAEREQMQPPAVVDLARKAFTSAFTPAVLQLVELAARDPAVERIFVHPLIKERLCTMATVADKGRAGGIKGRSAPPHRADREWLRVVRPWFGHHDHLHVRLRCPQDSKDCVPQAALAPGDGCGELAWWLSGEAERARARRRQPPAVPAEPPQPPPLPAACQALIDSSRS